MINSRRIAREMALKVLFQVDVGKQPLSEVLTGAMEQVRTSLDHGISQVVRDLRIVLQEMVAQQGADLSAQSKRQIKSVASAALTEVRALAETAVELARAVVTETPLTDVETAGARLRTALAERQNGIRKLGTRESLHPAVLVTIAQVADQKAKQVEEAFHRRIGPAAQAAAFVVLLTHGVMERIDEIDARLSVLAAGWRQERQAAVDRNIMRVAAYELLYLPDIPKGATINEAVELAKKYSTAESGRFVNGVLGALTTRIEEAKEERT